MQSAMGTSAKACKRCTDSARRRMLAAISILMEGFLGLPESHESRVVVLMLAGNDDNPTAICPIVYLPHTQSCLMARAAEQSLITGGRREDASRRFSTASALFGQRKLQLFTVDVRYWETAAWRSGLTIPISVYARKWQIRALYLRDAEKPHKRSGPNFSNLRTMFTV